VAYRAIYVTMSEIGKRFHDLTGVFRDDPLQKRDATRDLGFRQKCNYAYLRETAVIDLCDKFCLLLLIRQVRVKFERIIKV